MRFYAETQICRFGELRLDGASEAEGNVNSMIKLLNTMNEDVQAVGRIAFGDEGRGRKGKISAVPIALDEGGRTKLCLRINGGKRADFSDAVLRDLAAEFVRHALGMELSRLALEIEGEESGFSASASEAAAEGALAGAYAFTKYLSDKNRGGRVPLESFSLIGGDERGLECGRIIGESVSFARNLINEPGNILNPEMFVGVATRAAGVLGMTCEFYDEWDMAGYGMNALLAVGRGSANPPRLVHIVYRPSGSPRRRVVVVGKGVTFDSGGLCIKTRESIKTMKHDKSGACIMLGVMRAAGALKLPIEVHGIAGMVENMPDGAAYRPDDIITAMNGKTIEVQNTDAEGRLVLADVLTFASRLEPDAVIDVATLTGAAKTALGAYTAALMCDDDSLSASLESAARRAGERFHRFRMDDELLREGLQGVHADLRQSSPDGGATIIGGMFLKEFVNAGVPWAHIDIGGTGWYDREFGVYSKGASAYSLRTIVEYLRDISSE